MDVSEKLKKRAYELKQFRLDKKLSINALSKISTLSRATIYRIESGESYWNIYNELIYFKAIEDYIPLSKTA